MISVSTPVMEAIKVRITASRAHRKCTLPPCHKNPCFHSAALLLQRPRKKPSCLMIYFELPRLLQMLGGK